MRNFSSVTRIIVGFTPAHDAFAARYAALLRRDLLQRPHRRATTVTPPRPRAWMNSPNEQPGYLGIDSARSDIGITVSYWRDLESVRLWKNQVEHLAIQQRGRAAWYSRYTVRVARIEYEYDFSV